MNPSQIDRLLSGVPASVDERHRRRVFGYAATARRCDALHREESCGGHFREEHQTPDGEALRDDDDFSYVAAWEHTGGEPVLHKEQLRFQEVRPTQRSYA